MLVAILIVLNIPLFLFIAWLVFDSRENAQETLWETLMAILKIIFVPRIVRVLYGMDDSGAFGLLPIAFFFIACGGLVYSELWLLARLFPQWVQLPNLEL
jgi:hypothetical protein